MKKIEQIRNAINSSDTFDDVAIISIRARIIDNINKIVGFLKNDHVKLKDNFTMKDIFQIYGILNVLDARVGPEWTSNERHIDSVRFFGKQKGVQVVVKDIVALLQLEYGDKYNIDEEVIQNIVEARDAIERFIDRVNK